MRDKPWQPQQGYDQKDMSQATPPTHDQTQNMPKRGHPGGLKPPACLPCPKYPEF